MTTTKIETAEEQEISLLDQLKYCAGREWFEISGDDAAELYDFICKQKEEIERLREECNLLRKHCDRMASLAIDNAKDTERAIRYGEALRRIGDSDTCMSLMTHPPICKRAYDARAALKEEK